MKWVFTLISILAWTSALNAKALHCAFVLSSAPLETQIKFVDDLEANGLAKSDILEKRAQAMAFVRKTLTEYQAQFPLPPQLQIRMEAKNSGVRHKYAELIYPLDQADPSHYLLRQLGYALLEESLGASIPQFHNYHQLVLQIRRGLVKKNLLTEQMREMVSRKEGQKTLENRKLESQVDAELKRVESALEKLRLRLNDHFKVRVLQTPYLQLVGDLMVYRHLSTAGFPVKNGKVEYSFIEVRRWIAENFIGTTGSLDLQQMQIILDAIALEIKQSLQDPEYRFLTSRELNQRLIRKMNYAWTQLAKTAAQKRRKP